MDHDLEVEIHGPDTQAAGYTQRPLLWTDIGYDNPVRNRGNVSVNVSAAICPLETTQSYFSYEVSIYAKFGSKEACLYTKPYGTSTWNDNDYNGTATLKISTNKGSATLKFLAKIDCDCDSGGTKKAFKTVTLTFPPRPLLTADINGGTYAGSTNNYTRRQEQGTTFPVGNATPPSGKKFTGWLHTSGGGALYQDTNNNNKWTYQFGGVNGNIQAQYEDLPPAPSGTYKISFDANGGTGAPSAIDVTQGDSTTIPSTTPSKSLLVSFNTNGGSLSEYSGGMWVAQPFNGWTDGTNTYTSGASITPSGDMTLKAIWGDGTITYLPTPWKTRAAFHGWFSSLSGGFQYQINTTITQNVTLYAAWQYSVILYGNGGVYLDSQGVEHTSVTVWTPPFGGNVSINYRFRYTPTDPDEIVTPSFKGFATSYAGAVIYGLNNLVYSQQSYADLYAIYEWPSYAVNFYDGITTSSAPKGTLLKTQSVKYKQNATPPKKPSRPGYDFGGWIGSYKYVTSDRDIVAFWGFSPIWVRTGSEWTVYVPSED